MSEASEPRDDLAELRRAIDARAQRIKELQLQLDTARRENQLAIDRLRAEEEKRNRTRPPDA